MVNLSAFLRQRVRIELRFPAGAKRNRAMGHLARDAGAAVVVHDGRVTAWRLQGGIIVCAKRRYPNHPAAMQDMERIREVSRRNHIPERVYHCEMCSGYHLTSQPRKISQPDLPT